MNNTITATSTLPYKTNLFDLSLLEEMDDSAYLLEMLGDVLTETPKDLKEMQDAMKEAMIETVGAKAHKLKSSAAIIQAADLITLFEKIEIAAKKNFPFAEITVLVEQALVEYSKVEIALKIYIAQV